MRHAHLAAVLLGLAALPAAAIPAPGGVAPALQPVEEPAFMLTAEGEHVFECKPAGGPTGFRWTFVAPDATLFEGARTAATQTVPNLWEAASDRSSVTGVVRATQPAADGDLPWALYGAQPLAEEGMFAGVTGIQRVNTSGGVAPSADCDAAVAGSELRVPFTAEYYFYRGPAAG